MVWIILNLLRRSIRFSVCSIRNSRWSLKERVISILQRFFVFVHDCFISLESFLSNIFLFSLFVSSWSPVSFQFVHFPQSSASLDILRAVFYLVVFMCVCVFLYFVASGATLIFFFCVIRLFQRIARPIYQELGDCKKKKKKKNKEKKRNLICK